MLYLLSFYLVFGFVTNLNYMKLDPTGNGSFTVIKSYQASQKLEFFYILQDQYKFKHLKRVIYNDTAPDKYTQISIRLASQQNFGVVSQGSFNCVLINSITPTGIFYYLKKLDSTDKTYQIKHQYAVDSLNYLGFNKVQISPECQTIKIENYSFIFYETNWIEISNSPDQQYLLTDDLKYIFHKTVYDLKILIKQDSTSTYSYKSLNAIGFNQTILDQVQGQEILFQCNQRACLVFTFTQNTTEEILFHLFIYQKKRFLNEWTVQIFKDLYFGQIQIRYSPKLSNMLLQYRFQNDSSIKSIGFNMDTKPLRRYQQYSFMTEFDMRVHKVILSDSYLLVFGDFSIYPNKITQKIYTINGGYAVTLTLWNTAYSQGLIKLFIQQDSYQHLQTVLSYYLIDNVLIIGQTKYIAEALNLSDGQNIQIYNQSKVKLDDNIFETISSPQKYPGLFLIVISIMVPSFLGNFLLILVLLITILIILIKNRILKLPIWLNRFLKRTKTQKLNQQIPDDTPQAYNLNGVLSLMDPTLNMIEEEALIQEARKAGQGFKNYKMQIIPTKKLNRYKKKTIDQVEYGQEINAIDIYLEQENKF